MQQAMYPDKQICFTELGWATNTAHADHADYASVANQKRYLEEVADYLKSEEIVGFVLKRSMSSGRIRPLRLPLSVTGVSTISTGRKNGKD